MYLAVALTVSGVAALGFATRRVVRGSSATVTAVLAGAGFLLLSYALLAWGAVVFR